MSNILKRAIEGIMHPCRIVVRDESDTELKAFVSRLPELFASEQGELLYRHRNELRTLVFHDQTFVIKAFATPNALNRLVYGSLRKSKAQRSYEYAQLLLSKGIGSPEPIAWLTVRNGLLFTRSYYVSKKSTCPYCYNNLFDEKLFSQSELEHYLRLVARTIARMHNCGMVHRDLSGGNILFGDGERVELIDLNRIRFMKVGIDEGCHNLSDRLMAKRPWRELMAREYAAERGLDADECLRLMSKYNEIKD